MPPFKELVLLLLFLSDTQPPLWIETLLLSRTNNETATQAIFANVAAETTAAAVFHLGDMTSAGTSSDDWNLVEQDIAPLRKRHIPFYPTYGNHEYLWVSWLAKAMYLRHFPSFASGWYTTHIGNAAVILLNSNVGRLSSQEWQTQCTWYRRQLAELDRDTSVSVVIVGTHHPPFTNSTIIDPSEDVLCDFVPPYIASKKARLFISGHAHALEHFRQQGKDFLVIGGGGGLQHPLLQGSEERTHDIRPHEQRFESFHYLACSITADSVILQPRMLDADGKHFTTPYRFAIAIR
jgi:predicted phosphodiesterase